MLGHCLPSQSGSTPIIVLVSFKMRVCVCVCGPMLAQSCAMWCDDNRLREELVECHIGSFVQVHIETVFCDLIRLDLQAALQRSMDTLHLPVKRLQDDHVMMKVFVPHGVTCYSGTSYTCITQFQNWQATLIESGKRAYPGRNRRQ